MIVSTSVKLCCPFLPDCLNFVRVALLHCSCRSNSEQLLWHWGLSETVKSGLDKLLLRTYVVHHNTKSSCQNSELTTHFCQIVWMLCELHWWCRSNSEQLLWHWGLSENVKSWVMLLRTYVVHQNTKSSCQNWHSQVRLLSFFLARQTLKYFLTSVPYCLTHRPIQFDQIWRAFSFNWFWQNWFTLKVHTARQYRVREIWRWFGKIYLKKRKKNRILC